MSKSVLEIAKDVKKIKVDDDFIYNFILVFGKPSATVTRLKKGDYNFSKESNEIIWKNELFFRHITDGDIHFIIDEMQSDERVKKYKVRFVVAIQDNQILAYDTKTRDSLDIALSRMSDHVDFFMPWAGLEKFKIEDGEAIADIKASEKMARLYDEIVHNNEIKSDKQIHDLNIFFSRLLFCFFAEDTGIFKLDYFTSAVKNLTKEDGSDTHEIISTIFNVLNQEINELDLDFLKDFPYVNGNLFNANINVPKFTFKSRQILIECGGLNWAEINPDIFGSMIQTVVNPGQRADFGMHYTSVTNIMKVISPLFLDELQEEFEKVTTEKKLIKLWNRIAKIKIFDPACGSGNFLIIAYKEIREIENQIIKQLLDGKLGMKFKSKIKLSNFYGIEINDFAYEIAILSLYLAKHQQNLALQEITHDPESIIPLKDKANIVCENATRVSWEEICPKENEDEIYILGNPPYLGFLQQTKTQKKDMDIVFNGIDNIKKLDYISCWLYLGANYINNFNAKMALVSTNSIIQGEQVALFWPHVLKLNIEIGFAYQSFHWKNNAKGNAGITCVIIGLRAKSLEKKYLFSRNMKIHVPVINAYLSPTKNIFITKLKKPLSNFPIISLGSSAYDGGYLMFTSDERRSVINQFPEAKILFKQFVGSAEFIRGIERYCLWINNKDLSFARSIPVINERLNNVEQFRKKSDRAKTFETASTPNKFTEDRHTEKPSILVPIVTSERREYLTLGFLSNGEVIPNSARAIYEAEAYIFGVLSSKMHMTWVKSVGGRLRSDIRYSAGICYNSFPFPDITNKKKNEISELVYNILDVREQYSEKTLAQLYDPEKMPEGLKRAHNQLDLAIENCYKSSPFESDEKRLEYLFKLYEKMISEENNKK